MRSLRIYRPSDKGNGAAFQFSAGNKKKNNVPVMFIEAAPQTGPKPKPGSSESPFNWRENKIVVMLNIDELGSLLASIKGLDTKTVKFVHKSEGDNMSTFELKPPQSEEEARYGNWKIAVSKNSKFINSFLSTGQLILFSILAEGIIKDYYLGDNDGNSDITVESKSEDSEQS